MDIPQRGVVAVFLDLGDTIMAEETEVKDASGATLRAELVPGAAATLRALKERGYRLALVADTMAETYRNVLRQHGLYDLFDAFAISTELGCEKPDGRMFESALNDLQIERRDRHRVVMVGNNLSQDIAGAHRAALFTVWVHWNDRYPAQPETEVQTPDATIGALPELFPVIDGLDHALRAADPCDLVLARQHAPLIRFDRQEPFLPVLVGCTIADRALPSPSFPRILRPPVGGCVIEYAVYWDWDIGHHYELEHLWVHVDADGTPVRFEGSWHGGFHCLWMSGVEEKEAGEQRLLRLPSGQLTVCSQPGKHAFAPHPGWFEPYERFSGSCTQSGGMGMLVTPLYRGILSETAERNRLAEDYLCERAFVPTFDFSKCVDLGTQVPLVPWRELDAAIPKRVDAWMTALVAGEREPTGQL